MSGRHWLNAALTSSECGCGKKCVTCAKRLRPCGDARYSDRSQHSSLRCRAGHSQGKRLASIRARVSALCACSETPGTDWLQARIRSRSHPARSVVGKLSLELIYCENGLIKLMEA